MSTGAVQLTTDDFPGYAAAVQRENLVRAAACLGMTERVCGVEAVALTSRRVRLLAMANSPFLARGVSVHQFCTLPNIGAHIVTFLWAVSTRYAAGNTRKRLRFIKRHRPLLKRPIDELISGILDYIGEAYLDAPESEESKSFFAFEASIVISMHHLYGLPIDFWEDSGTIFGRVRRAYRRLTGKISPLDVPLKIYWQLQKAEHQYGNPKATMSNPSDKFIADGLSELNKRQRREREYQEELRAELSSWKQN